MKNNNKQYCQWSIIRYLQEKDLMPKGKVISIVDYIGKRHLQELMIFLKKQENNNRYYEVIIEKNEPTDSLILRKDEEIVTYGENDKKVWIIFSDFDKVIDFLDNFQDFHTEFAIRPYRPIEAMT